MKRTWIQGLDLYLIAPPVLLLCAAGIWLAVSAALENIRLGRATDRMIAAVSVARDMRLPPAADPAKSAEGLLMRLSSYYGLSLVESPADLAGRGPQQALENPWGGAMRLFLYPAAQSLRIELGVPVSACRDILTFYASDAKALGLQRVDVRDDLPSALWRLVYEESASGSNGLIEPGAVAAGCGQASASVMSLTFRLNRAAP